jgi:hypothetical protein
VEAETDAVIFRMELWYDSPRPMRLGKLHDQTRATPNVSDSQAARPSHERSNK